MFSNDMYSDHLDLSASTSLGTWLTSFVAKNLIRFDTRLKCVDSLMRWM